MVASRRSAQRLLSLAGVLCIVLLCTLSTALVAATKQNVMMDMPVRSPPPLLLLNESHACKCSNILSLYVMQ